MKYDELKRRIEAEGMYGMIDFDTPYGREFGQCIYRNADGTFNIREMGERGNYTESCDLTEEEACDRVYARAVADREWLDRERSPERAHNIPVKPDHASQVQDDTGTPEHETDSSGTDRPAPVKYDELKRRAEEEKLEICFDRFSGGYNAACIARDNGTFTVNFCDERGKPFSEHPGMSEEEACEFMYSYAVNQKHLRKLFAENRAKWEQQDKARQPDRGPEAQGSASTVTDNRESQKQKEENRFQIEEQNCAEKSTDHRKSGGRWGSSIFFGAVTGLISIIAVGILLGTYELLCLVFDPGAASLIVPGLIVAVFIGLVFREIRKGKKRHHAYLDRLAREHDESVEAKRKKAK